MYSSIDNIEQLQARVKVLEQQQAEEWLELKSQVHDQYERLKPANLIRNAFGGLSDNLNFNPDGDILRDGAALVSGMIVNSVMAGSKNKTLKKTLSVALFSVAMYFITRYREEIIQGGNNVMDFITDRVDKIKDNIAANMAERRKGRKDEDDDDDSDMD